MYTYTRTVIFYHFDVQHSSFRFFFLLIYRVHRSTSELFLGCNISLFL